VERTVSIPTSDPGPYLLFTPNLTSVFSLETVPCGDTASLEIMTVLVATPAPLPRVGFVADNFDFRTLADRSGSRNGSALNALWNSGGDAFSDPLIEEIGWPVRTQN
jgi:hypothetical protein